MANGLIGSEELLTIDVESMKTEDDIFDDYFFAFRVVDKNNNHYNAKVGDELDYSYVWEDGEWTDEELDGVSAIDANRAGDAAHYYGDRVLVIKSRDCHVGNDVGELVMIGAVVVAVIDF